MLEDDSATLRELAKACKDAKEKIRYLALHAISKGHAVSNIAEIFCVDDASVYRWIDRWQEEKNLMDKPKSGRTPSLGEKDREKIKKLIEEGDPKKHGISASFWDCNELHKYFFMRGKSVSQEVIRKCLNSMKAHYVKAVFDYEEADLKEQEKFARKFFREMKKKLDSILVFFEDEMAGNCSPKKGYGWTFEKRLVIKVPQRNKKRVSCFGAVEPFRGEAVHMSSSGAKAPAFIKFLDKMEDKYPKKRKWIYLDNWKVHKSRKVAEWLEKHPGVELRFMPPYSPKMNLQENLWNYERHKFLNNKAFRSPHHLATGLSAFVRGLEPEQIRSTCSLNTIEAILE